MSKPEYKVEKFNSHQDMQVGLNKASSEGWGPLHYAIQGSSGGIGFHYIIFARPSGV